MTKNLSKPLKDIQQDVHENKDVAAISYIWILSVVILFFRKDSPFVQFHAKQATTLFILSLIFWLFPSGIRGVLEVFVLAGMLMGFINTVQGEYYKVPAIYLLSSGHLKKEQWFSFFYQIFYYLRNLFKRIFKQEKRYPFPTIVHLEEEEKAHKEGLDTKNASIDHDDKRFHV